MPLPGFGKSGRVAVLEPGGCLRPAGWCSLAPLPLQARDRTVANDPMAANSYGRTARSLNIAALCLGIVGTIILVVILAVIYRPVHHP